MAVVNLTSGSQAILSISNTSLALAEPDSANALVVPFMQDITVNASTGVTRYKVLDSSSEKAFTTPSTNQITLNVLVDDQVFFGNVAGTKNNSVETNGLFKTQNDKTRIYFSVAFNGSATGDDFLKGEGFISGLSPTASMDGAVWLSPVTIEVDGNLAKDIV